MTSRHLIALAAAAAFGSALALAPWRASAQQGDDQPAMEDAGKMQHRATPQDREAFLHARMAAVHAGLMLSSDQEKLWPPVESAIRDAMGQMRAEREKMRAEPAENAKDDPIAHMRQMAQRSAFIAENLTKIADAASPLYASLTDDQKWRLHVLLRAIHVHRPFEMGMMRQGMGEWRGWRGGEWRQGRGWDWRREREGAREQEETPSQDEDEGD